MKIKKEYQGSTPENKILNVNSTSQTDTYSCAKINEIQDNIEVIAKKTINIASPVWTYNTSVKFFTLPYSSGIHSYIITGVVSYSETNLYSNVMLLVTQTGTNIKIDRLVGNENNTFTNNGVDLYVKNMQAQSNLRLYGVCQILR